MNSHIRARPFVFLAAAAIVSSAIACGGSPATTAPTAAALPTATAVVAPAPAAPAPAAAPVQAQTVSHKVGTTHALQPKRLESVIEIDMGDHYFGNPQGLKNPVFTLPVGKTVGIHFHNEGTVMHEFTIGRTLKKDGGYEQSLFELVKADIFYYYGEAKSEIGGATFEDMEVEPGLRDVWLRFSVPATLKGEWEIGCFAPEHYDKGMKTKIIFQ